MTAVRLYAALREAAGQRDFDLEVPAGVCIGEILRRLVALRPKLDGKVLDENGNVPRYVAVFVNGRDIRHLSGLETPVQPEDEIAVFPPVAGGVRLAGAGNHEYEPRIAPRLRVLRLDVGWRSGLGHALNEEASLRDSPA